jgi:hypothetical protein
MAMERERERFRDAILAILRYKLIVGRMFFFSILVYGEICNPSVVKPMGKTHGFPRFSRSTPWVIEAFGTGPWSTIPAEGPDELVAARRLKLRPYKNEKDVLKGYFNNLQYPSYHTFGGFRNLIYLDIS